MTAQPLMRKSAISPMWTYTLGLLVLWVINPELRRVYDWRVGYSPISVIALLPLVGVLPHLWSLTTGGGWRRLPRPIAFAAWLYIGAFFYGLALAVVNGNLLPGSYSFANFVVPIGVGLWIAADADALSSAYPRLTRLLFAVTTLISLYGIVQWALVPPWDAYWLHNVARDQNQITFGHAEPYQIRVFSVLNSPGPFGNFMAVMLLMSLPRLSLQRPLLLAQIAVWLIAFGLSLDRTGWVMFAIGLVVFLLVAPRRAVLLTAIGASGFLLAAVMAIVPLFTGNDFVSTKIGDRVATLGDVGHDDSVADRAELYSYGAIGVGVAPMGRGLGILGTSTKLAQEQVVTDFDSGVLARLIELGIPGALMLGGSFVSLGLTFFDATRRSQSNSEYDGRSIAASALAVLVGLLFLETSGDVNGLLVLMLWLIAALAVRSSEASDRVRLVLVKA